MVLVNMTSMEQVIYNTRRPNIGNKEMAKYLVFLSNKFEKYIVLSNFLCTITVQWTKVHHNGEES
jgi:hypothetical protein